MILCPACQRHLFAGEATCPFCGIALAPEGARPAPPEASLDLSRAQRYAIGAAIAVSIAGTGCGGTQKTDTTDPSGGTTNAVAGPAEGEQDAGRGEGTHADDDDRLDPARDWRNRSPCTPDGQCPPYGCVFPDEGCDIVRA